MEEVKIAEKSNKKNRYILKNLIAIFIWTYILIKLFIFDIDIYLINKFLPEYKWILNMKFFIMIFVFALFLIFIKNKNIILYMLYILFYPFILLFWKIPFLILKQKNWIIIIAFISSIISFFKSIKYNIVTLLFYLISLAIILGFSNKILIFIAMSTILTLLILTYIFKFISIFKKSDEYVLFKKVLSLTRKKDISTLKLEDDLKNLSLDEFNEQQIQKWTTNLQMSVLVNRICLLLAKKIKEYQNSRFNFIYYVYTILILIMTTIFTFAVINYGLFKIDTTYFIYSKIPNFFTFFYYSFNNFLFNNIQEIVPVLPISQIILMIEYCFVFFLSVIFISLLFSVKNEKYINELNEIIQDLEIHGNRMEGFIKDEFKINSIEDAMIELENMKSSLVSLMYKITENI